MVLRRSKSLVSTGKAKEAKEEKLFVGTLGVNCVENTLRCYKTISTSCKEVKFMYIDNGSSQQSVKQLQEWEGNNQCVHEFEKAFNGRNAGVAVGWNQLIRKALAWGATKIVICNNDIAFGRYTLDGLCEAYDRLRNEIPETVMVTGTNHCKDLSAVDSVEREWSHAEHPDFACFMITPETIERIGEFCEDYDPAFFEDNDMHWRILLMGYKAFGTNWAPYGHMVSQTRFFNPDIVTHQRFDENKIKFFKNMVTDDVNQQYAVDRYDAWIKQNPDIKHPTHQQVLKFCIDTGVISQALVDYVKTVRMTTAEELGRRMLGGGAV